MTPVGTTLRDGDRQAVYDVEDGAFAGTVFAEPVPFHEAAALLTDFCAQGWWRRNGLPSPLVRPTRADSRTSYTARDAAGPVVHLSPDGCAVSVVAHELAHVLADRSTGHGEPDHGPGFRRADVALAGALMGEAAGERLAARFAAARLALGPPVGAVPAPPRLGYWASWRAARIRGAVRPASDEPIVL